MSCDESVIRKLGDSIKKDYSLSLLSLATGKRRLGATPLAFGEGDTKGRIKNVMNYKKPMFWIISFGLIIILIATIGLVSNPQMIILPEPDVVQSMEMEQFNEGSNLGSVIITDEESIDAVVEVLSDSKKTMRYSTNDYPTQSNYLIVRLILEGEQRTLCLYSDNGSYYIEEPYVGIYKSKREASVATYRVYTAALDLLQTQASRYIGYISDFAEFHLNHFRFDPVEWVTLEDTERIVELDIEFYDMPDGYYIHNPAVDGIVLEVDENTEYNFIDWRNDFVGVDEDRFYSTTDKAEFINYLNTYSDRAVKVPFWVETIDGYVLSITEQFVN